MKTLIAIWTALILVASATVIRHEGCTFKLAASGDTSGPLYSITSGQNRIGSPGRPAAIYTIGSDGGLFDRGGRGCMLTPDSTQFQCNESVRPVSGFSVECDGILSYRGSSRFVACHSNDGGLNVYKTSSPGETGCVDIQLTADTCHANCTTTASSTQAPDHDLPQLKTCPAKLSGAWQSPDLIVPVSSADPDRAYSNQTNGQVTRNDIRSIFSFSFNASYAGKTCSLVFLFPRQDQLTISSFMINGDASLGFSMLSAPAIDATTHRSVPPTAEDYGQIQVSPGNSHTIATFDCQARTRQSYIVSATSTDFIFLQDHTHPAIGLYVTAC